MTPDEPDTALAAAIVDAAPVIVLVLDPRGRIRYTNPYFEELTGKHLRETRGAEWFTTFLPERDHARIRELFADSIEGMEVRGNVNPIVTATGEEREIEWHARLHRGTDGEPEALICIGKDVTAEVAAMRRRQESEEKLRRSEERLRSILNGMFAFVGLYDLDGRLVEANDPPLKAAGLERAEVLGKPFWEAYWWSHSIATQEQVRDALRRAAQGEVVRDDFRVRLGDDHFITLDAMFGPLCSETGAIESIVGSGVDVTDRKRAEEDLSRAQSFLLRAERLARLGSWSWNLETNEVQWSPEMYRQYGLDPEQFPEPSFELAMSRIHPDDIPRIEENTARGLETGELTSIEYRVIPQAGKARIVRGEGQLSARAGVRTMYGFAQDVTERRDMEGALRASLREKETLLREVHHRVKNNLQMISGLLHFQAKRVHDPRDQAAFQDGRKRLTAMILVHEMLYQSKELSRVQLVDYASSLIESLSDSFEDRAVRFRVSGAALEVPIEVAMPCGMLICELVTNVFKYAFPDGRGGTASVVIEHDDGRIKLSVADDGVGFPSSFVPTDASSFGWRLVRMLTEQLGGELRVRNDGGAMVAIRFPDDPSKGSVL